MNTKEKVLVILERRKAIVDEAFQNALNLAYNLKRPTLRKAYETWRACRYAFHVTKNLKNDASYNKLLEIYKSFPQ